MAPESKKSFPLWAKWLISIIIFSAAAVLIVKQLPGGGAFSTDLTRIGQGQPAMVVVYDVNSLDGKQVMELLEDLRGEYKDRVQFLVADLGTPDGRSFARHYKGVSGSVIVLKADGYHMRTMHRPESTALLHQVVRGALATQVSQ
ncbi:MAG: hypothetical protein ISEC1_P1024 [Thiomicrorhabdus sp.]|nr:MAG: hypothetical protein ISEC1_P1024 [Thiomicrorhabdus sp.]